MLMILPLSGLNYEIGTALKGRTLDSEGCEAFETPQASLLAHEGLINVPNTVCGRCHPSGLVIACCMARLGRRPIC
jgi:hypothetical protein